MKKKKKKKEKEKKNDLTEKEFLLFTLKISILAFITKYLYLSTTSKKL